MIELTPWERKALTVLERAALAGRACPTNDDVADMLDCSHSHAAAVIAALDNRGVIRIHREGSRRMVEIVATGRRTGQTLRKLGDRYVASREQEYASRNPLAVLHYHTPCTWCGCRPDACSCKPGRAARGEGLAA